ncbi:myosin1 [Zea mays]|uniref:Myosin1 n=1 Tax=Zea mays TaxID=4577 RepID=A0A1D6KSI4_MAIZE|nr:myosin1 [Zea mays]
MQLSYLSEPSVLYNLQYRYSKDMIYVQFWWLSILSRKFHCMVTSTSMHIEINQWIVHMFMQ